MNTLKIIKVSSYARKALAAMILEPEEWWVAADFKRKYRRVLPDNKTSEVRLELERLELVEKDKQKHKDSKNRESVKNAIKLPETNVDRFRRLYSLILSDEVLRNAYAFSLPYTNEKLVERLELDSDKISSSPYARKTEKLKKEIDTEVNNELRRWSLAKNTKRAKNLYKKAELIETQSKGLFSKGMENVLISLALALIIKNNKKLKRRKN